MLMDVDDVERVSFARDLFPGKRRMVKLGELVRRPDGSFEAIPELRFRFAVAGCDHGHVVTAAGEHFRELRNDELGPAITKWRHGYGTGRDQRDPHRPRSPLC